jgi:hypothetical protein
VNLSRLTLLFDTALRARGEVTHVISPGSGLILYPLEGTISVGLGSGERRDHAVGGSSKRWPEGPDAIAVVRSGVVPREVQLLAGEQPARVLRLEFRQ